MILDMHINIIDGQIIEDYILLLISRAQMMADYHDRAMIFFTQSQKSHAKNLQLGGDGMK